MIKHGLILSTLLMMLLAAWPAAAQVSIRDSSIGLTMVDIGYGARFTGADLNDRFGFTSFVGGEVGYKFKNNYFIKTGAYFWFGSKVKQTGQVNEMAFAHVWPDGRGGQFLDFGFIDGNGQVHLPDYSLRGVAVPLRAGKMFPKISFKGSNPNSGLFAAVGAQFIQHKIRINFETEEAPNLSDEMLKGFDRLTNGLGGVATIGYRHFSSNRYVNLYVAFDLSVHATQSRRSLNFDTNTVPTGTRTDVLYGFRLGWILPIYSVAASQDYYYY